MRDTTPIPLFPDEAKWLQDLRVGDPVTRWLAGRIPIELTVTAITSDLIRCGQWEFDRVTGGEMDLELGWDGRNGATRSDAVVLCAIGGLQFPGVRSSVEALPGSSCGRALGDSARVEMFLGIQLIELGQIVLHKHKIYNTYIGMDHQV